MNAMTARAKTPLSVRERVESVISLRRAEGTLASLTVSELCRLAVVNRASLYVHHRDLIQPLRAARTRSEAAGRTKPYRSDANEQLKAARHQIRALLLMIVELQQEIAVLQRRLLGDQLTPKGVRTRRASS